MKREKNNLLLSNMEELKSNKTDINSYESYLSSFLACDILANKIKDNYGINQLQKYLRKYPDLFGHLIKSKHTYYFSEFLSSEGDLAKNFLKAVKRYLVSFELDNIFNLALKDNETLNIPAYLKPFSFHFITKINTLTDLNESNELTIIYDKNQRIVIDLLNIANLKRFEEEYGFFSHIKDENHNLYMFKRTINFIIEYYEEFTNKDNKKLYLEDSDLSYDEFLNKFAGILDFMRKRKLFTYIESYDWLSGDFRTKYSYIFMDESAPLKLKEAFYKNAIDIDFLDANPHYIKYLITKDLANIFNINIRLNYSCKDNKIEDIRNKYNFIWVYSNKYGNEKMINLIYKYKYLLNDLVIDSLNNEIEDEFEIEKVIRKAIYEKISKTFVDYQFLINIKEFVWEYPDIFVDLSSIEDILPQEKERLTEAIYNKRLTFDDIKLNPKLTVILKNKNLKVFFGYKNINSNDLELLEVYGNEKFLELCSKYGRYMDDIVESLHKNKMYYDIVTKEFINFSKLKIIIESIIAKKCLLGQMDYNSVDAPLFLKKDYPELFVSDYAPLELQKSFYNIGDNKSLFIILKEHKEWMHYLVGKAICTAMLRRTKYKEETKKYFDLFGTMTALKLGITKTETVNEMIKNKQVDVMKIWFDKTGQKFIPEFIVMQNFNTAEIDKFLLATAKWTRLLNLQDFASTKKAKMALLKLAYTFGVFDNDQRGYKKLENLLTGLPKKVDKNLAYVIKEIEEKTNELIYKENSDESFNLVINPLKNITTCTIIRKICENYYEFPILTPFKVQQIFWGFELKYDRDFRQFLSDNIEEILTNQEYIKYIADIQKRFSEIKVINSNLVLTLELAINYIKMNKYLNIEVGNEKMAELAAKVGYSQKDFEILQEIYNYGKQRFFGSIPRIENKTEKYSYEILRLDDPLILVIGVITNCCQKLNANAQECMIHSMVDKHGRIFVIKDKEENIIAQSWVWRSGNVICFDNIEIPNRAFIRANAFKNPEKRYKFAKEIFDIYKKVAQELIENENNEYCKLLENAKITLEQFNSLKLSKVTVGLGYNDIALVIKNNAKIDNGLVARPYFFTSLYKLNAGLYLNDSKTQYILEKTNDYKDIEYIQEPLAIYKDEFIIYDDRNFDLTRLLTLQKLEVVTKKNNYGLKTLLYVPLKEDKIVSSLAQNYDLDINTTKIVMNSNFAIIYDEHNNVLRIKEFLFNNKINTLKEEIDIESTLIIQIKIALEQISYGKNIEVLLFSERQIMMFNKVYETMENEKLGRKKEKKGM